MTLQISVTPNPFTDLIAIDIEGDHKETTHYIVGISDLSGRIVRMLGISMEEGMNTITIDKLSTLSPGEYCLDIKNTEGKEVYSTTLIRA